eukprot:CAMPEP_0202069238 /NCGR_PEP_ID=MMETSP0964-20121228/355_1 /ASSEMBLY_ACC=CAM_ASM_000500 /TAXON_ID=4773 /ORGANISM="Schizochytrium aggregatum, Strain ATCC28209" /LENGTH=105 /DNA_ID=CAMNT_0048635985 /DNA_START=827 /DNA_END=1144 /DNA_ORIENTATION=+
MTLGNSRAAGCASGTLGGEARCSALALRSTLQERNGWTHTPSHKSCAAYWQPSRDPLAPQAPLSAGRGTVAQAVLVTRGDICSLRGELPCRGPHPFGLRTAFFHH